MASFLHYYSSVLISTVLIYLLVIPSSMCHPLEEKDLRHICSKTHNSSECLNQFKSDPRSLNTDEKGLAGVAVDLALNKANAVHTQYNQLYRDSKDSKLQEKYIACSKNYNDAIRDLQLVKKFLDINRYKLIPVEINDALQEVASCRNAFKREPIDPAHSDDHNKEFQLLSYMVKVTSQRLIKKFLGQNQTCTFSRRIHEFNSNPKVPIICVETPNANSPEQSNENRILVFPYLCIGAFVYRLKGGEASRIEGFKIQSQIIEQGICKLRDSRFSNF
ncbi:pectinesterase inhibitor-like [Forsythia ovata]|uniref:Pectinesterase inhibitor-like n=1 Tax=Forsythia ovata TaxID=205694 RepID=A0ABD1S0R8_9LAMI